VPMLSPRCATHAHVGQGVMRGSHGVKLGQRGGVGVSPNVGVKN